VKDNVVEEAMARVAAATEEVIKQGGIVVEDCVWDAMDAALDGASPEVLVETLNGTRKDRHEPQGAWTVAVGNN
jgi:hypothetical protein